MKLKDLNPEWVSSGGSGVTNTTTGEPVPLREKVGVIFDCPCGGADCQRCYIPFNNPADGGPSVEKDHPFWQRTGDTFEIMTLTPSIQRVGGCAWHGFVTNGEIIKC